MSLKREGGVNATCYVDKLVKIYPNFGKVLQTNTDLLVGKSQVEMEEVLGNTITSFVKHNKGSNLTFRIHTSGDFFNQEYASAWAETIKKFPNVKFWVYTRSFWAVPILIDCSNLAIYLSVDVVNQADAMAVYSILKPGHNNLGISFMGTDQTLPKDRRWVTCPELSGKIKNEPSGGACSKCRLCLTYSDKIAVRNIYFPIH